MDGPTVTAPFEVLVGDRPIEVVDLDARGGRPLVLLHEGLGSVGLWRDFPARLHGLTGRRVVAYSRPGHGASAPPARPRTPAFFDEEALDVLPALLDALAIEEPILVGHSDGASIALIHAAHRPVGGLALMAPHAFVEEVTLEAIRETRETYLEGALRERMARHHADPDAAFWGWCDVWLDPTFPAWTLDAEIAAVSAPTLLVQSGEDPYGSLAQLDRIEAGLRGPVERLVVTGGHSPHLEAADATLAALHRFVAGLP